MEEREEQNFQPDRYAASANRARGGAGNPAQESQWAAQLAADQSQEAMREEEEILKEEEFEANAMLTEEAQMQIAEIDAQIEAAKKKAGVAYYGMYLFLVVGAAVTDIIIFICDLFTLTAWISPIASISFAVIKYNGILMAGGGRKSLDMAFIKKLMARTTVWCFVSSLPYIGMIPVQTPSMVNEFTIRKLEAKKAGQLINELNAQKTEIIKKT